MGEHTGFHEPIERLSNTTQDTHRALVSLQEELEAVDWYRQRADACTDAALREVLLHNMREEVEHAAMLLEWLRRRDPVFDEHLRTYLFQEGPITEIEEKESGRLLGKAPAGPDEGGGLSVGTMKGG